MFSMVSWLNMTWVVVVPKSMPTLMMVSVAMAAQMPELSGTKPSGRYLNMST